MIESQQVLEWMAMGEAKGEAKGEARGKALGEILGEMNALLRLLEKRFPPAIPGDLTARIRETTDLGSLRNWFDLALSATSLNAFRQAAGL